MRIDETNQQVNINYVRDQAAEQVQQAPKQQAEQTKKATEEADKLSISKTADSINKLASTMKADEQFRANRVDMLKGQIESGTYNVSSKDVAEKMMPRIGSFITGSSA